MPAEVRHSTCALDCPDACSLLVTVDGGRAIRLRGNPGHPVTQGFLCAKVSRYLERQYHPDRLLYPQRRTGAKGEGRFERISWDEALNTIATRLKQIAAESGPEAILPYSYAGTMGYLQGGSMDRRFFHRLGASRLDRTICSAAGGAGLMRAYGVRYGTEPEQFRHSRLILAWGANVLTTNVHLWPFIVEARRNGARFYTIDPVRHKTASLADRHYFINPGSDLAFALGLMHVIFSEKLEDSAYIERHTTGVEDLRSLAASYPPERVEALTGIARGDLVALAREYATVKPAVIRLNYGPQRSERGAAATTAIAYLPVITGSWRDTGGGLQLTTSGAFQIDRAALEMPELQPGGPKRLINMVKLGEALGDAFRPPVKALFVYNSNPAAVAPDQNAVLRGLAREDLFTVVSEQFQTDTADYADILLPATTFLEHTDVYFAYGHYHMQLARPAVEPPGECLRNTELFRRLAQRMGFNEDCFRESDDEMIRGMLGSGHPFLEGITLERLEREHSVRLNLSAPGAPFRPFAEGGFGTPSGRCEFDAGALEYVPPVESRHGDREMASRYPLELVSPKAHDSINSTFGNRADADRETSVLQMHQEDAEPRGIADGDAVRIFNARGSIRLKASVNGAVRRGVVSAPAVRWNKNAPDRRNVNALVSGRLTDAGGGPTFYSCLVEVEKCGD